MDHDRDYARPVEVAEKIYWVGFHDQMTNFHCNPYLIIDGDQAVLIDAGSRSDFALVMMKILQTGIPPDKIVALIYQHTDPDLCGSLSNVIDICANPSLKVLSEPRNNIFISYYLEKEKRALLTSIDKYNDGFTFGGRALKFFKTPYAHDAGSFVTYDVQTKTLFTSDLFGSISRKWDLFLQLTDDCYVCKDYDHCPKGIMYCPIPDIVEFHKGVMPSEKALGYAMDAVAALDFAMIAPQHGSLLTKKTDIDFLIKKLRMLKGVGIDGIS